MVVLLCWEHGLYDALLYIYNKAMQDYTTPMEEMLQKLRLAVESGRLLSGSCLVCNVNKELGNEDPAPFL
ncbi:hypothetical protein NP493_140g01003 [Ridgeia piscesae]|uniref:Vacuolar protein sorting-associated protein 8 central domain-containing protein n=1 Tax=Ridgeia piscesae TaxID=27915 RepID=A0AAD9P513_RIDPI|nr:hypothetical protein NP493_140g01003 [Ridgeia piscesae]